MSLSSRDLDWIADEIYRGRRIAGSIYCGACGYNLKTLPYMYRCPECGTEFNARPTVMKNIFTPMEARAPILDFLGAVALLGMGVMTGWHSIGASGSGTYSWPGAAAAVVLLILGALMFDRAYGGLHGYLRSIRVARRIAEEEAR